MYLPRTKSIFVPLSKRVTLCWIFREIEFVSLHRLNYQLEGSKGKNITVLFEGGGKTCLKDYLSRSTSISCTVLQFRTKIMNEKNKRKKKHSKKMDLKKSMLPYAMLSIWTRHPYTDSVNGLASKK
uniref:Uncharacterized protein n=1 Tax=Magallana gigas TaxID=29159 RepID=K1Q2K5_MAGGI